jgi:hypothetical protein
MTTLPPQLLQDGEQALPPPLLSLSCLSTLWVPLDETTHRGSNLSSRTGHGTTSRTVMRSSKTSTGRRARTRARYATRTRITAFLPVQPWYALPGEEGAWVACPPVALRSCHSERTRDTLGRHPCRSSVSLPFRHPTSGKEDSASTGRCGWVWGC